VFSPNSSVQVLQAAQSPPPGNGRWHRRFSTGRDPPSTARTPERNPHRIAVGSVGVTSNYGRGWIPYVSPPILLRITLPSQHRLIFIRPDTGSTLPLSPGPEKESVHIARGYEIRGCPYWQEGLARIMSRPHHFLVGGSQFFRSNKRCLQIPPTPPPQCLLYILILDSAPSLAVFLG